MKITQNLMRVKELLLNPPTFSDNQARLQTNLDTDFLKLIAIVSMLIDHIGSVFFPGGKGAALDRTAGVSNFLLLHDSRTAIYPRYQEIFIPFGNFCTDFTTLLYPCFSSV